MPKSQICATLLPKFYHRQQKRISFYTTKRNFFLHDTNDQNPRASLSNSFATTSRLVVSSSKTVQSVNARIEPLQLRCWSNDTRGTPTQREYDDVRFLRLVGLRRDKSTRNVYVALPRRRMIETFLSSSSSGQLRGKTVNIDTYQVGSRIDGSKTTASIFLSSLSTMNAIIYRQKPKRSVAFLSSLSTMATVLLTKIRGYFEMKMERLNEKMTEK